MSSASGQSDRAKRALDAFAAVVALPPEKRDELLAQVSANDPELRRMIDVMLSEDARTATPQLNTGAGLRSPGLVPSGLEIVNSDDLADLPALNGHYRVLRQLGEGGMGVVYLAEQTMPRRLVALKAVKSGVLSQQVLRRFMLEAHILGRLHHPGVAQIFEAGAVSQAGTAQACLVMEYVEGEPITTAAKRMRIRDRVELVARVCDAAQHAHQRGVIHRDLKPTNILVTSAGDPKILDFGVARSLSDELSDFAGHTHEGQIVGTLGYMSPEQLEGGRAEVDAASDVYALGAVLYEVLAERPAFNLRGLSLLRAAEAVRTQRVTSLGTLNRELRGDLETIVEMAMQPSRDRRYTSAAALAEDLRRHLDGRAILARRDSSLYLLSRVARRHWVAAAVSCLIVAAVLVVAVWSSVMAQRNAELAGEAQIARVKADSRSELLAAQLRSNTIERARSLGQAGNLKAAEDILWPMHRERPSAQSGWALWDLYAQMPCIATLPPSSADVWSVAVAPDESRFATGDDAGHITVWSVQTLSPIASFRAHSAAIRGLVFTGDSATLLSTGIDGSVSAWSASDGAPVRTSELGSEVFGTAIFEPSPGVFHLAAACRDGFVRVIDAATMSIIRKLPARSPARYAVSADRTGRLIAVGDNDGYVRLWGPGSDLPVADFQLDSGAAASIALSADGSRLAVGGGSADRWIRTWVVDPVSGGLTPIAAHRWKNGTVRSLQFSPNGEKLLAGGYYRFEILQTSTCQPAPGSCRFSQTTHRAAWIPGQGLVVAAVGNRVRVWRDSSDRLVRRVPAHTSGYITMTSRGSRLFTGGSDGVVRVWNIDEDGRLQEQIALPQMKGGVRSLSLDSTDRFLAVTASEDSVIRIVDVTHYSVHADIPVSKTAPFAACLGPSASWVASIARGEPTVRIWDVNTAQEIAALDSGEIDSTGLTITGDDSLVVSCHARGRVIAWDTATWRRTAEIQQPSDIPWCVVANPGTARVTLGSWVGTASTWDPRTATLRKIATAHTQLISDTVAQSIVPPGLSNSPPLPIVATASSDGTICIGDPESGVGLATLPSFEESISSLAFMRQGAFLVAGLSDGTLAVVDMRESRRSIEGNLSLHAEREP